MGWSLPPCSEVKAQNANSAKIRAGTDERCVCELKAILCQIIQRKEEMKGSSLELELFIVVAHNGRCVVLSQCFSGSKRERRDLNDSAATFWIPYITL